MTAYIVFLSVPLAFWMIQRFGLEKTFIYLWIPIFLLLPFNFSAKLPLVPLTNFMQLSMVPILFELIRQKKNEISIHKMDILIILYVIVRVYCDFLGRGYKDAQNYAAYMCVSLVGSYLLGKYLINRREMEIATARMFVLIFILWFPMFLYELRSWVSPIYKVFSPFFPDAHMGIAIRYGMARVRGSFEHPILACVMIIVAYRLHKWLAWQGYWKQSQKGLLKVVQKIGERFPFQLETQISFILISSAIMTISRGPWIAGFVGAALVMVGNFKNRKLWLIIFMMLLLIGGGLGRIALDAYTTVDIGEELSHEASTMLYRKEMIDRYMDFFLEKFWTGWGLTKIPTVYGMSSLDNAFFQMALQHGIFAVSLWVVILSYAIMSQIKFGLKAPTGESPIGFTFAGIYLCVIIAFTTVYMGSQTEPLIFLLLGWGEGVKHRGQQKQSRPMSKNTASEHQPSPFRRIVH